MSTEELLSSSIPLPKDELIKERRKSNIKTVLAVLISNAFIYLLYAPQQNKLKVKEEEREVRANHSRVKLSISKIYANTEDHITILLGRRPIVKSAYYYKDLENGEHILEVPTNSLVPLLQHKSELLTIVPHQLTPKNKGARSYEIIF